jgi:hypothetical protein
MNHLLLCQLSILDFRGLYFCAAYLPANNLRKISTTYLRGYWKGSENGRVVTIESIVSTNSSSTILTTTAPIQMHTWLDDGTNEPLPPQCRKVFVYIGNKIFS